VARHFLALWPDAPAAASLERLALEVAQATRGRAVPIGKIHLTLAFLGETSPELTERARGVAAMLHRGSVGITVDRVGSFRNARVAWAGSTMPSEALMALQADLALRLREAGFVLEERAYVPHLTLARRIAKPLPDSAIEPIAWHAQELALVRTDTGTGRYATLGSWPLRDG
jgi:2'-5' RNA ligase